MKTILVIEDEQDIRSDILKMLSYEGFEALGAENGKTGILLAKEHLPDLIICDIMMPGLNGYQVLSIIRSHQNTARIPFIFLTAKATREDMRKGMRLGADDYLAKPFTITELLATIEARFKRHEAILHEVEDLRVSLGVVMPSEIRNALTGILGFAEFLTTPEMLPGLGEVAEIGKVIYESGITLQRLVENYLIYTELRLLQSKPEETSPWVQQETIESDEFIAFFSRYKAKDAKRSHDLDLQLATAQVTLSSKTLQKILIELLDNAFKYSESGQGVRVVSTYGNHQFTLGVINEGVGMSAEQIAHIQQFTHFGEDWYEKEQGSGLGLILVQLLVQLCGGELTITSRPGLGTNVSIIFKQ